MIYINVIYLYTSIEYVIGLGEIAPNKLSARYQEQKKSARKTSSHKCQRKRQRRIKRNV